MAVEYECCESQFFLHIFIIVLLVLFAGLMSGLTLGLMSLSLVDLEVLAKSGTPKDRVYAEKILPVVRRQHLLLCTLLICNAAAMEALPIFLDTLVTAWGAILISVTLILLFGEIIPQSVCTRYGLAIGASVAPFVRILVWVCFPVAYPISKLLDYLLGKEHVALFRRAELKTLVNLHGNEFFLHIFIIVLLVLFAGLMSGLTLGLMSLSLVDLEVLAKSGTPKDRVYAEKILPVVRRQHLLLCTLLICNAAAMEALPIFLDTLVTAWGAILISVTLILLFGEIIPQSVCTRYGLAIGASVAPFVRVLVWVCFPVAYPISKLLDYLLGKEHVALFRRAELKTLVNLHGNEAGKGGELTHDETTIIAGALELSEKIASDAMTPISETFSIDINAKLDRNLMNLILEKGHSRVPVYYEQPTNIIGLVLVKNLLTIHPDDEIPVRSVTIRRIPKVLETLPLYDILNEFQKGHSHMAVVVRQCHKAAAKSQESDGSKEVRVDVDGDAKENSLRSKRSFHKWKSFPNNNGSFRHKKWNRDIYSDILEIEGKPLPKVAEEEEAVGIITMEDVIEELLQEEIFDETDHQFEGS